MAFVHWGVPLAWGCHSAWAAPSHSLGPLWGGPLRSRPNPAVKHPQGVLSAAATETGEVLSLPLYSPAMNQASA